MRIEIRLRVFRKLWLWGSHLVLIIDGAICVINWLDKESLKNPEKFICASLTRDIFRKESYYFRTYRGSVDKYFLFVSNVLECKEIYAKKYRLYMKVKLKTSLWKCKGESYQMKVKTCLVRGANYEPKIHSFIKYI